MRPVRRLVAAALLTTTSAAAQTISPDPSGSDVIADAVGWLTGTLLGNVATGIAILAVAIIAILLMTGRIEWGRAALVVIGIFAALGRLDTIVDKMPFLAGFNVRLLLVVQGLAQLDRLYGQAGREVILQNAGIQLFFAPNDEATAAYVSGRLGMRTMVVVSRSRSGAAFAGRAGHVTRTRSPTARPLMSADEVRRMRADEVLVFVEGARPVRAAKIRYYADACFAARLLPPITVGTIEVPRHRPFSFDQPASAVPAETPPARRRASRRQKSAKSKTQLDFDPLLGPRGVGRTAPNDETAL
jgi:type IV secretory pathway TraG/TraD family ATPase VirD4